MLFSGLVMAADPPEVMLRRLTDYYKDPDRYEIPAQDRAEMITAVGGLADAQNVLILALTTDHSPTVTLAAAAQLGNQVGPAAEQVLRTAVWNPQDLARYKLTIRGEAARSLGRIARTYRADDRRLLALVGDLQKLAREDRTMAPAAVDGIALCGLDKPAVRAAMREIAASKTMTYPDLARVRVIQWWRQQGIKDLKVGDALESMLRPGNSDWVRLTAAHALIVGGQSSPAVHQALREISGPAHHGEARDYARALIAGDRTESDYLLAAGPAIKSVSAVCSLVSQTTAQ